MSRCSSQAGLYKAQIRKRCMPIYRQVTKMQLPISAGGYFSPSLQCNALTHTPPQHNHTDTPEPLREGCKVLPDDFPKVQINLCTPSITKFCGLTLLLQLPFSHRRRKRAMPHQGSRYQPFLYLVHENSYIPLLSSTACCEKNKKYFPCEQAKQ